MAEKSADSAMTELSSTTEVPFDWDDISAALGLNNSPELYVFILNLDFLQHWVLFRDTLPLSPEVPIKFIEDIKGESNTFALEIYMMMEDMWTCKYDHATTDRRQAYSQKEHLECFIYHAMRDLAQPEHEFNFAFDKWILQKKIGYEKALTRIEGVLMLAINLITEYTSDSPSDFIRDIEMISPARNPGLSPLPEVRKKWLLERMSLEQLRVELREKQRKAGEHEKELLVNLLLQVEEDEERRRIDDAGLGAVGESR